MTTQSLFSAQASNATGSAVTLPNPDKRYYRAPLTIYCYGTFGSGTVKVQATPDGTNWVDVNGATFTSAGAVNIDIGALQLRAVLSGATAPSVTCVVF